MAHLEWSSAFSIGVPVFDEEHKKLVGLINALDDAVETGSHATALRKIENELVEYAIVHFQHEEMFFADFVYPDAAKHIAEHTDMKKRIFAYRQKVERDPSATLCREMLQTLREWLANHIMAEDKKFGAYLRDRGHGKANDVLPVR